MNIILTKEELKKLSLKLQGCSLYMARDNTKDVIVRLEDNEIDILLRLIKEKLVNKWKD